jgi:hypothetical protein
VQLPASLFSLVFNVGEDAFETFLIRLIARLMLADPKGARSSQVVLN